ncbi:GNAT family N-acetyltransferase [Longispora sp. NPDC051575]|uniref:GNAT family N-acetyltransferase n=1 Tax=Longispora sp. NPDC051575 TaxID=3154943 RepID=UPI0034149FD8
MRELLTTPAGYRLRPWAVTDVDAVLEAFAPPEMLRQSGGTPIDSPGAAGAWLRARRAAWDSGSGYSWAVVDPAGAVAGNVAVSSVDRRHDTGWVSYWTTHAARGRGVAGAATRAVADWALTDLGLFRLELGHRVDNPASCRVARRAGFAVEGLERAKLRYDGTRHDVELHARLAIDPA